MLFDIKFTIGISSILVQVAATTVIDAKGKTTTQIYSEEVLANGRILESLYDNNFMTDDAALDDITDAKYSVTDIETDNKDEIAKAEDLLTYSTKSKI